MDTVLAAINMLTVSRSHPSTAHVIVIVISNSPTARRLLDNSGSTGRGYYRPHLCGHLLPMSHVARSVCLSVCLIWAQTTEPIQMPYMWLTQIGPRNLVLDWDPDSRTGRDTFEGMCAVHCSAVRMIAVRTVHLPPLANVSAILFSALGGRIYSPLRGVTSRRCGRLPNYFGHLLLSSPLLLFARRASACCDIAICEYSEEHASTIDHKLTGITPSGRELAAQYLRTAAVLRPWSMVTRPTDFK